MAKKRIVVVCPGRGSYTKDNLGYLKGRPEINQDLKVINALRAELSEPTISELDGAASFRPKLHTKGEHASPLIFTCALADFLSIDIDRYEIVAIAGNSMGWYLSLAFGGCLDTRGAFQLIQTMGSMMKPQLIGGQVIYPVVDENWQVSKQKRIEVFRAIKNINQSGEGKAYLSIELGGYLVIGGDEKGVAKLLVDLPAIEHYPFQLINHGAFHTPLLKGVSDRAFKDIPKDIFTNPLVPLIDGRGHVWQPYATDIEQIYNYTLGHQVYEPYDFTASVSVALKEFAPDHLVLLGPGNSLGGALGQIIIQNQWHGITNKKEFSERQKKDPFLLSMGMETQKRLLTRKAVKAGTGISTATDKSRVPS